MTSHLETFLENARRLADVRGPFIPPLTPELADLAEHALVGEFCPSPQGDAWAKIDLDGTIDWSCRDQYNPQIAEMYLLRFRVFMPLGAAYRETGDEKFAACARRWLERFLDDHVLEHPWQPPAYDCATQYDLRMGCNENAGWLGSWPAFAGSRSFDEALFDRMAEACRVKLEYLMTHVYPDRNIRATHGEVLLLSGIRLSFFEEADGWRRRGVRILNDAVQRQSLPDGAHLEAVPGYHDIVKSLFTHTWRLSRGMPELGLVVPVERVAAMHDYTVCATAPHGGHISIGDTGYTPRRARGSTALADERAAFRAEAGLPASEPPTAIHFPYANQVFLRDGWHERATCLSFDGSIRRSFHWHPAANAITLYAHGRPLLIDTGYPFKQSPDFPAYGTRTAHHSTCTLNGLDQKPTHPIVRLRSTAGYDLIEGLYEGGYWPVENGTFGKGLAGSHHRTLLWIRRRAIIVLDHMYVPLGEGEKANVDTQWQFAPGTVTLDAAAGKAVTGYDQGNLLMLFPLTPEGTALSLHHGEMNPQRGWVPLEWGRSHEPAPMVRLSAPRHDAWHAVGVTVLVPFAGNTPPKVQAVATPPGADFGGRDAGQLKLHWADGGTDTLLWIRRLENAIDQQHGVDTDASLVHLTTTPDGRLSQGLVVDGTFLECPTVAPGDLINRLARIN